MLFGSTQDKQAGDFHIRRSLTARSAL